MGLYVKIGAPTAQAMYLPGQSSLALVNPNEPQKASRPTNRPLAQQSNPVRLYSAQERPSLNWGRSVDTVTGKAPQAARGRMQSVQFTDVLIETETESIVQASSTVKTGQSFQSQAGSSRNFDDPLVPTSVKAAKDLREYTHNDLKNFDVGTRNTNGNLEDLQSLTAPKIIKALNALFSERMASRNEKLYTNYRNFSQCQLKARVYGTSTTVPHKRKNS